MGASLRRRLSYWQLLAATGSSSPPWQRTVAGSLLLALRLLLSAALAPVPFIGRIR